MMTKEFTNDIITTTERNQELLRRVQSGDNDAANELVLAYMPILQATAAKEAKINNRCEYEDLVQDLYIFTLELIQKCGDVENFGAYLKLSIKNFIINKNTRGVDVYQKCKFMESLDYGYDNSDDDHLNEYKYNYYNESSEDLYLAITDRNALYLLISELPELNKRIFIDHAGVNGKVVSERSLAETYGITRRKVRTILSETQNYLKTELVKLGYIA